MSQVATKNVKISKIMWEAAFNVGFKEKQQGIPLDYDRYPNDANKQWSYERGRQFAVMYSGNIKNGKKVQRNALLSYHNAIMSNHII